MANKPFNNKAPESESKDDGDRDLPKAKIRRTGQFTSPIERQKNTSQPSSQPRRSSGAIEKRRSAESTNPWRSGASTKPAPGRAGRRPQGETSSQRQPGTAGQRPRRHEQSSNPRRSSTGQPKRSSTQDLNPIRKSGEADAQRRQDATGAERQGDVLAVIKPKRTTVRRAPTSKERSRTETLVESTIMEDADDFFSDLGESTPAFAKKSTRPRAPKPISENTQRPIGRNHKHSQAYEETASRPSPVLSNPTHARKSDQDLINQMVEARVAQIEQRFQEKFDKLASTLGEGNPQSSSPSATAEEPDHDAHAEHKDFYHKGWGTELAEAPEEDATNKQRNRLDFFLYLMIDRGSSDFHFHVGTSPTFRKSGDMVPMRYRPIRQRDWERFIRPICPPGFWDSFIKSGDIDFAYEIPGLARFRVNLFRQHSGGSAVFRVIPSKILTLEELGMPPHLTKLADLENGLVLITGPTGSGKSTTLAALIHMINKRKPYHIITLEDPIEFVHCGLKSIVHQREIGAHTKSFNTALNGAVREDPDLILVGEMRDQETIRLALEAAEKGVLVFGTLHTNSATKTVDRIVNVFPVTEQEQIRTVLADTLEGVVSQQLLRREGGGRVAALEIMFSTSAMGNIIREGKTSQLSSLIQTGQRQGMTTMDDSLISLIDQEIISPAAALEKAIDKDRFKPTRR